MEYFAGTPASGDKMWCLEMEAVAPWCVGRGLDPGAGGRTLAPDTVTMDLLAPAAVRGDATTLPFGDESFDYVVNAHLLEHLADPRAAIIEWLRVVRPGGHVAMVIPNTLYTAGRNTDATPHRYEWSPREFGEWVLGWDGGGFWFEVRPMLTWAPGRVVEWGVACPHWSFCVVIEKGGTAGVADQRKNEAVRVCDPVP